MEEATGKHWDASDEFLEPESEITETLQCLAKGKRVEVSDGFGWRDLVDVDAFRAAIKKFGRRIATWEDMADFPWPRRGGRNTKLTGR